VVEKNGGALIEERIYLSGFEVFRRRNGGGSVTLARETLHIMDDKQRIALVEIKTVENGNPIAAPEPVQRYQFSNHLGSASLELDHQSQIISYEEYYPYGSTSYQAGRSAAEVSLKRYRYTGMERDEESGFSYHGARYYAAWIGRWISCDPSGLKAGFNLYSYGASSPVVFLDTSGNEPLTFPVNEDYQIKKYRGRPIGPTQTLPPPGVSQRKKASDGGKRGKSTSSGREGKEGGLEGGVGTAASKATKYATTKYIEEGAGEGPGGLGEPGDVGTGMDVGTGTSGTGSPTGTRTETRTRKGQASGGKEGGSKESSTDAGNGDGTNPDDSSLLGDLAALASLIADPESSTMQSKAVTLARVLSSEAPAA
jgi:RHS repeat-associated protein